MSNKYTYDYPMFCVCVDILTHVRYDDEDWFLLIKRKNDPFKDMLALPGGHVEIDEEIYDAAIRELFEETYVDVDELEIVDYFDRVDRDPSARKVSFLYYKRLDHFPVTKAGDDAKEISWIKKEHVPYYKFAFDHKNMIDAIMARYEL